MSLKNSNSAKYRADVDGLRAIAILVVLFFHADLGFSGGYVGVDVFFVISGFLITGLILKDLDRGQFRILEFWERRVRRILPALSVVVLSCLVAGWFLFFPLNFKELGESAVAQSMLSANVYFWLKTSYFGRAAEVKPLLHTWSLAVEEQFYLFFPFLLVAIKRYSRKSLVPAILLICGLSFSLSVFCSYQYPSLNFYLLPTRAWELSIGALLAAIPAWRPSSRRQAETLCSVGLLAILYSAIFYNRETPFPGVAAILPCVGTALVIWSNGQTLTSVGRLLATRPFVFIGLISYSLYLWHWPMLVFFKYWTLGPMPKTQCILILLGSMVMAVLSWKFVETPFRKRLVFKSRSRIFSFAGITTAALFLAGLVIFWKQGLPSRFPAQAVRYAAGITDSAFHNNLGLKDALNGDFIELGAGDKHLPIDLLVWGDSHAMAAMPVLDVLCKEHSIRGVAATHSESAPLVGYDDRIRGLKYESTAFQDAVVAFIRKQHVGNVLLVAYWNGHIDKDKGTDQLRNGMLATINAFQGSGARIWVMKDVPRQQWDVPRALAISVIRGSAPDDLGCTLAERQQQSQRQDPIFEGLATQFPGVAVLDPADCLFSPSGRCRVADGGRALYRDAHHLSVAGAMFLRPLFEPIFAGIDKSPAHVKGQVATR